MIFDLSKIQALKVAYDKECVELKGQFEVVVKDPSIPLDDRWALWTSAPKELKNEAPWIKHLKLPDYGEISWYDDACLSGRGEIVYLQKVHDQYLEEAEEWTEADFIAFKTWVLDQNLYSFCWDW